MDSYIHKIEDKQLQQTVYHNLRLLLDETDRNKFEDLDLYVLPVDNVL